MGFAFEQSLCLGRSGYRMDDFGVCLFSFGGLLQFIGDNLCIQLELGLHFGFCLPGENRRRGDLYFGRFDYSFAIDVIGGKPCIVPFFQSSHSLKNQLEFAMGYIRVHIVKVYPNMYPFFMQSGRMRYNHDMKKPCKIKDFARL